ncbi:MAG: hypothetical protein IT383_00325, partial [Deltaproteobacteria bacterium]|nr:hypothetical protein [Deltaproteobacteria bacterium]
MSAATATATTTTKQQQQQKKKKKKKKKKKTKKKKKKKKKKEGNLGLVVVPSTAIAALARADGGAIGERRLAATAEHPGERDGPPSRSSPIRMGEAVPGSPQRLAEGGATSPILISPLITSQRFPGERDRPGQRDDVVKSASDGDGTGASPGGPAGV